MVMQDQRYFPYLAGRVAAYKEKSDYAVEILSKILEVTIHAAKGAFYMTLVFKEGALNAAQTLPLTPETEEVIAPYLEDAVLDQRFAYYVLAAKGICVVPLSSGFNCDLQGFRFTLLEPDMAKFMKIVDILAESIRAYLAS
jgi:aspartate/methionine/tyrosine aminotransferase